METFENDFRSSSFKDHIKSKAMWAGSITPINIPDLYGLNNDNELIEITNNHTPALLKSIDEIIVNAIDHCKGCEKNTPSKRVTKIHLSYTDENYIIVYNNGPGIPLKKDKTSGEYLIEQAFSKFLAGTNIEKPKDSIKGGINGLGAKIANVHSDIFIVETISNKQKYNQVFKNRLSIIEPPVITKTDVMDCTTITFLPSYTSLGYDINNNIYFDDIKKWLKLRMYQVASYLGESIEVKYNDLLCTTTNTKSLADLLISDEDTIVSTTCKNSNNGYNLHMSVIINPNGRKPKKKLSIQNMTIINGVVSNKGSHVNFIRKIIKEYIDTKISKITKGSNIEKRDINIKLVICGCIPGIDWSGQNKDTLQVSNKVLEQYKINDTFLKQLSTLLIEGIVINQSTKTSKVEHDKYIKARNITQTKLKKKCILLAAEGDSAITLLRTGLTQKANKKLSLLDFAPSFDWLGIISLQGVILNAAKEITEYETSDGFVSVKSDKLKHNKRLNMLADAFGLKYEYTYDKPEELNTLNYGKLILCTDQDLDGTGKIASLVLVWIYTFWPALLKSKRIGKLMTPVIRIYKSKDPPIEFYYEQELEEWLKIIDDRNKYKIKYYKGLATHDETEAATMFTLGTFNKSIYTYTMDDAAHELFKIYFGVDPCLRKKILSTPVKHLTYKESLELKQIQEIPIGRVQLDIDTKLYKNEAINRQLPHAIDGLNPARRKILMASIIRFNSDSKEIKIFQLGGYVADKMLYHHGDASLNKTIVCMAQNFQGAKKYPYLTGIGQFGDRHGSKAGSPRYISVKLSPIVHNIFPSEDRWLLPYVFDEGIRAEPEYFIPILPMAVLESYQIVTEGWNHKTYGRKISSVLNIVNDYINGDTVLNNISEELFNTHDVSIIPQYIIDKYPMESDGDIRYYKDSEYSFGNYVYNEKTNIITITELPIGIFTMNFIEQITKSCEKFIEKIEDYSSTNEIEINIYLKQGVIDTIIDNYGDDTIDPIEDCFNLRTSLKPNLNYYSCDKGVLEFRTLYIACILYWAPMRKKLYMKRLVRKEIIFRLVILKYEMILKYITMSNVLNISKMEDEEEIKKILKKNGFIGINTGILSSPDYINNEDLENSILVENQYDYILDLKERDLTKQSAVKIQNNIDKNKKEYEIIQKYLQESPFAGISLWKKEIDILLSKL